MAVSFEDIIEQTGGCGRFQVILSLIIHSCKIILGFCTMFMVFGAKVPDWWCMDDMMDGNESWPLSIHLSQYQSCTSNNGTACKTFKFVETPKTIVSEWNLVCDDDWVTSTIMSVQMAGMFAGAIAGGHIADRVGRKPPLYGAISVETILLFVIVFSNSWIMFAAFRFLIGVALGFHLTVHYTFQSEFVLPHWRIWIVAIPSANIAVTIFALVAWLLQDWIYIHVVAVAVGVASVTTCWFVPESLRWKLVHGQVDDATNILKYIAKVNRSPVPKSSVLKELAESVKQPERTSTDRTYSLLHLFKSRDILKCTGLLMFIWIFIGVGSSGIQFGIQKLYGNLYVNMIITAAINSPLQFVQIFLQNRFGRKKIAITLFSIYIVLASVVGVMNRLEESSTRDNISRISALISLTTIDAAWSQIQVLTIELYPTVIRNIGYGFQNTMVRVGAVIGPQLVFLDTKFAGTMYFVCAVTGLLSILLILLLPETKGADLQDKMPEKRTRRNHIA